MAKHTIPAQEWISCDCCGTRCDRSNRAESGTLLIHADALDMSGAAVAPNNARWELCDSCLATVRRTLANLFSQKAAQTS